MGFTFHVSHWCMTVCTNRRPPLFNPSLKHQTFVQRAVLRKLRRKFKRRTTETNNPYNFLCPSPKAYDSHETVTVGPLQFLESDRRCLKDCNPVESNNYAHPPSPKKYVVASSFWRMTLFSHFASSSPTALLYLKTTTVSARQHLTRRNANIE